MKPGFLLRKSEKSKKKAEAKPLVLDESNFKTLAGSHDFNVKKFTPEFTEVTTQNNDFFNVKIENGKVIMTKMDPREEKS